MLYLETGGRFIS